MKEDLDPWQQLVRVLVKGAHLHQAPPFEATLSKRVTCTTDWQPTDHCTTVI